MRLWGQTGDRPDIWISAADPVYLEPMLDHLALHALRADELSSLHLRAVYETLQTSLCDDARYSLVRVGQYGYLRSSAPFKTASLSATVADGDRPDKIMPQGIDAIEHDKLQAEIQMILHDLGINAEREASGMRPVNSLWLWGGGMAPQQRTIQAPMLFADDPLFRGYWNSCHGKVRPWPGSIDQCLRAADADIVAVCTDVPDDYAGDLLTLVLGELRSIMQAGRATDLTLIFRDGLEVRMKPLDRFRLWRGTSPLLGDAS